MTSEPQRMLIVMAHPDDESFGMGGAIVNYANNGTEVYLICATNGDVGTIDDELMEGFASKAERRLHELDCAAATLGLKKVYKLGYRDSGMPGSEDNAHPDCLVQADPNVVTEQVTGIVREIRPQVIVTFDPYGGYGHPDHIACHKAALAAFDAAGDPERFPEHFREGLEPFQPKKLYYNTFGKGALKAAMVVMRLVGRNPKKFGRNKDIDLTAIAQHDYPIHARIRNAHRKQAQDAVECHTSQLGKPPKNIIDKGIRALRRLLSPGVDTFMRARPEVKPGVRLRETDLFAGL
ncbi:MAG: GlcNAc-PI de-N-acetylase [Chloroflexi bacterium]|nr:GlcNAc-PI de-N-acetylase [Chloroflexota bacterium]